MPAIGLALALCTASAGAAQPSDTIVMSGLHNPRGLTFAPGHALYVAEAGTGGPVCTPQIRGPVCVGLTGSVSRSRHGQQRRIVEGLPSYAPFAPPSAGAVGPSDVSLAGRRGYVVIGLAANPAVRVQLVEHFGWIARSAPAEPSPTPST